MGFGANRELAAARCIGRNEQIFFALGIASEDQAACREIRPLNKFHQVQHIHIIQTLPVVQHVNQRVAHLPQVVRRDAGGHTHCNPRRAVDQQIRDGGGQHGRFLQAAIKVIGKIGSIFVDVSQQFKAHGRHAGLGITHRGRCVPVYATEVALTVYQLIAHRKVLRHAGHCVIHGNVTMRVIFAEHLAYDSRALAER